MKILLKMITCFCLSFILVNNLFSMDLTDALIIAQGTSKDGKFDKSFLLDVSLAFTMIKLKINNAFLIRLNKSFELNNFLLILSEDFDSSSLLDLNKAHGGTLESPKYSHDFGFATVVFNGYVDITKLIKIYSDANITGIKKVETNSYYTASFCPDDQGKQYIEVELTLQIKDAFIWEFDLFCHDFHIYFIYNNQRKRIVDISGCCSSNKENQNEQSILFKAFGIGI